MPYISPKLLTEGEIYFYLKKYLTLHGWEIIGGEPPDGSDDIRRIEIRNKDHKGIGSTGSLKIDLMCFKGGIVLLIEIKPKYSLSDIEKLNLILNNRLEDLFSALRERCNIEKTDIKATIKCIANSSMENKKAPSDFVAFVVDTSNKVRIEKGKDIPCIVFGDLDNI